MFPTSLMGVVADHGDWPVERIAAAPSACASDDADRWWLGSVGHDETMKLTDMTQFFHEPEKDSDDDGDSSDEEEETDVIEEPAEPVSVEDSTDEEVPAVKKRKPPKEAVVPRKKGKQHVEVEHQFFDGL